MDSVSNNLIRENTRTICDGLQQYKLFQHHPVLNKESSYTLDLIFSTVCGLKCSESSDPLSKIDDFHPPVEFVVSCAIYDPKNYSFWFRDFRKANYVEIDKCLSGISWDDELLDLNCDEMLNKLYDKLNVLISDHVPLRRRSTDDFPSWFSKKLRDLIRSKRRAHALYNLSHSEADKKAFKDLRNECIKERRICYRVYISKVENSLKTDLKSFWSFINSKKKKSEIPVSMYLGIDKSENINENCNLFAQYFKSFYSNMVLQLPPEAESEVRLETFSISEEQLMRALKTQNIKAGPGPDGIPASLLYNCSASLIKPLHIIFNKSLQTGIFPNSLKRGFITPIHKSGDKLNIANYRPVSRLNSIAKLFDSIVTKILYEKLSRLIVVQQHGFMKKRSTESNLLFFTNYILTNLKNSKQIDAFHSDFSKAFDSVNLELLIRKLHNYGIRGAALRWIQSYLTGRQQQVIIKNNVSELFPTYSGVPQGSNLGPLLFLIFINNLAAMLRFVKIVLFADDAKIFMPINSPLDFGKMQRDIDTIATWGESNGIRLNISKCNIVTFTRTRNPTNYHYLLNDELVNRENSVRDLGVIMDSKLDFKDHLDTICTNAMRTLGLVKKMTYDFRDCSAIIHLYKTLVVPKLMYASTVWSPHAAVDVDRIESVQHVFLRYLAYKSGTPMHPFEHDYSRVARRFEIPLLSSLRDIKDATCAFKLLHRNVDCAELSNLFVPRQMDYNLRDYREFNETHLGRNYKKYSAIPRMIHLWNLLPSDLTQSITLGSFKRKSKSIMQQYG